MKGVLVAGVDFVSQPPTDSWELTDSTMVRNATNGCKRQLSSSGSPSVCRRCADQLGSGTISAPRSIAPKDWMNRIIAVDRLSAVRQLKRAFAYCRVRRLRRE